MTVAVFWSKLTWTSLTPDTFSSDFLTVIGQSPHRHVLHVERDGFRGAASATKGKAKSTAISSLRMVNFLQ
ncbi:hypothetical protein P4133_31375 [Pseudomonas aeruginosa]|nr:hypothetical protein [Pseudomonas aeruginosa]